MKNIKVILVVLLSSLLCFISSCTKANDDNFNKIKKNMSIEDVIELMGNEDEIVEATPNITTDTYYWFDGVNSLASALKKLQKGKDTKYYSVVIIMDMNIVVDMASGYVGKDLNETK